MNIELAQSCNLIVDCDEILCNICPKWVKKLYEKKEDFKDVFDFSKIEKVICDDIQYKNLIMGREIGNLETWLLKEGVIIDEKHNNLFHQCYEVEDFYEDLPLTKMGVGISRLSLQNAVKKVYVITKVRGDNPNLKSKIPFIKSLFPKDKLEIIVVPLEGKKSDYIKNINIRNGFIFEDDLNNVHDYLDNGVNHCNIYIPRLGYNLPTVNLYEKSTDADVCITYYEYVD